MTDEELRKLAERLAAYVKDESGWLEIDDTCSAASSAILSLMEERERLQDRLEMRHAYTIDGKRIAIEPGSIPDGISCRDETIRQLDKNVDTLRARATLAETRLARAVEALRWLLVDAPPEGYDNAWDNARTVLSELERENVDG